MRAMGVFGLGVALMLLGSQAGGQGARRPADGAGRLVPDAVETKLGLTGEQAEKVRALEKEFAEKSQDFAAKARDAGQKARQDKDRAAYKKVAEYQEEGRKLRADYESKVLGLFTDEQKKSFEQGRAAGAAGARPAAGRIQLASPGVQERLGLSAGQKEKLGRLEKEFEEKSLQVLTEEQRQRLEGLKKGRRQP